MYQERRDSRVWTSRLFHGLFFSFFFPVLYVPSLCQTNSILSSLWEVKIPRKVNFSVAGFVGECQYCIPYSKTLFLCVAPAMVHPLLAELGTCPEWGGESPFKWGMRME